MITNITKQNVEEMAISAVKVTDEKGADRAELVYTPTGKIIEVNTTDIYADKGKVFRRKKDGAVLSTHITIGTEDSVDNYEEVTPKQLEIHSNII